MILMTLFACTKGDAGDSGTDSGAVGGDEAAAALWAEIDGYDSWGQDDVWAGIQPSSDGTHGDFVQIWGNDAAIGSTGDATAAEGSILVKQGYNDDAGADPKSNLTVIWKSADYGGDDGWFWGNYGADGSVNVAGASGDDAVGGCTGCHSSGSDARRYVTDTPGGE